MTRTRQPVNWLEPRDQAWCAVRLLMKRSGRGPNMTWVTAGMSSARRSICRLPNKRLLLGRHCAAVLAPRGNKQHIGRIASISNQSATRSRSTEGAKGRKLSRYLTLRFSASACLGSADREYRTIADARGPNSIGPDASQPLARSQSAPRLLDQRASSQR